MLRALALVGQLGFIVAGGTLAGFGLGFGFDLLVGTRAGRVVGIFLGLGAGLWTAGRELARLTKDKRGDS